MSLFTRKLSTDQITALVDEATAHGEDENHEAAWKTVAPLRKVQSRQVQAARALAQLLEQATFDIEQGRELADLIFDKHASDRGIVNSLGEACECLRNMRYLNNEPPEHPVFEKIADRLVTMWDESETPEDELVVLWGLSTAARMLGRRWDETTERAYLRITELKPTNWSAQYSLGLFYKTRGRFADGLVANQKAAELGGTENEAVRWNLGICATGARQGAVALAVWKQLGNKIEMGPQGLPEGRYPSSKVRLAERPLATRTPENDADGPGSEETIWIERLSPCHGIIRSALYYDLGVDFGDIILVDGAPVTYHAYDGEQIPVFPHLATLSRQNYWIYEFGGTQGAKGEIDALTGSLSEDAVVYVHTEQFQILCRDCWENPGLDHAHNTTEVEHGIVTGKICAPPNMTPQQLRHELETALGDVPHLRLFVPHLTRAAGEHDLADVEERRLQMIRDSLD